jgi:carboxyl-terminal processing protease
MVAAAFAAGALVGARVHGVDELGDRLFGDGQAELSSELLDVVEESYFRDVDTEGLENASAQAIVRELRRRFDDRFSHYFGPRAYERFRELTGGEFSGVGLSVSQVKRGLRVATVFESSPAREGGIRPGDVITAVNGRSIAGTEGRLATAMIKGRPGTEVRLTVLRPSTGESRELELTRERLRLPIAEGELRRAGESPVGYVRLLAFSSGAHAQLREEIERLRESGAEGLVLDLRGNGGGLLTEAVLTSSVFVEDGTIVSTSGRSQERRTYEAVGDALPPIPTVVLVNRDTASASEILAAALRDADLARLIGEATFGKGSFQEVIPLDGGGAVSLTVGEYLTRDGESLADDGLEPDVAAVDRPATKRDEALRRALEVLAPDLQRD